MMAPEDILIIINLIIGIVTLILGVKWAWRCTGKLRLRANLINCVAIVLIIKQILKIVDVLVASQATLMREVLDTIVLVLLLFSSFAMNSLISEVDRKYPIKGK
jgi:uncharacterized membrane protein